MKLVGALICLAVSVSLGFAAGKRERARTSECEAFLAFFAYVQNQISYFFAPTKRIYRDFQNDVLERVGFLAALRAHEEDEIYFDVWEKALADSGGELHLSGAQMEIVKEFGAHVGKSNGELQMKHLAYYAEALSGETEKQKSEMKKNIKIYRTLGFAVGMTVMILVL